LRCRNEQIRDLRHDIPEITTEAPEILFAMTDSTISDVLRFKYKFEYKKNVAKAGGSPFSASRQILINQEEPDIVNWIHQLDASVTE
jgi:hypothetical protein